MHKRSVRGASTSQNGTLVYENIYLRGCHNKTISLLRYSLFKEQSFPLTSVKYFYLNLIYNYSGDDNCDNSNNVQFIVSLLADFTAQRSIAK